MGARTQRDAGCPSGKAGPGSGATSTLTLYTNRPSRLGSMGEAGLEEVGQELSLASPRLCALATAPCTRTSQGSWWCTSSSPVSYRR